MLKAVVTDPDEVFRLGTAKADENRSFRRYLSTYHVSEKPFQILASEAQRQIDCTACANCCRHSVVPVSKMEIENIARRLGVTPEGVTHHYGSIKPAISRDIRTTTWAEINKEGYETSQELTATFSFPQPSRSRKEI